MDWDTATVRALLMASLDDPTLVALCLDHFPEVHDTFSRGMRKDEKVQVLLEQCAGHDSIDALVALLTRLDPGQRRRGLPSVTPYAGRRAGVNLCADHAMPASAGWGTSAASFSWVGMSAEGFTPRALAGVVDDSDRLERDMTTFGAWIHTGDDLSLEAQLAVASANGISAIRSYGYDYAAQAAPSLRRHDIGLLAGMHVDAEALVADWRSQVRLDDLARYHELGVRLDAICVGNELREGGDASDKKRFTARLSFGLANVLDTYRRWLDDHGFDTPLTYAMESIVFDAGGRFHEWLWPLVDACDVIGLNLYPMGNEAWFTFGAFEESRRFLHNPRVRHDRLALWELHLRRALTQAASVGKPLILTETGFPSAVGYRIEGERRVIPDHDTIAYATAMAEFVGRLRMVNEEYGGQIRSVIFYEWRDNLHHAKIWNVEQSPIHVAFGLCDRFGVPKFDIGAMLGR